MVILGLEKGLRHGIKYHFIMGNGAYSSLVPIVVIIGTVLAVIYGYPTLIIAVQKGANRAVCPVDLSSYGEEYIKIEIRGKIASVTMNFNYRTEGALSLIDDKGNPTDSFSGLYTVETGDSAFFSFKPLITNTSVNASATLYLAINSHLDFFRIIKPRNRKFLIECEYVSKLGNELYLTNDFVHSQ
jgi:hypothetical protein